MRLSGILIVVLLLLVAITLAAVNPTIWVWVLFGSAVVVFVGVLALTRGR